MLHYPPVKHWRVLVAVIVAVVWSLSAPLAMASSHCMAMGAICEGPCGVPPCVIPPPLTAGVTHLVTAATSEPASHSPEIGPTVPELPPK